ncbi:MAG: hypothetical protein AB4038_19625 [Prochloraceae cyanobacterium]
MSPKKLTDRDKTEILTLYRNPEETTSTLAVKYNVSSSTISRFLKSSLSEQEYEELIKQKRQSRSPKRTQKQTLASSDRSDSCENNFSDEQITSPITQTEQTYSAPPEIITASQVIREQKPASKSLSLKLKDKSSSFEEDEDMEEVNVLTLEEMLGEDLGDLDEDEEDVEDTDEDEWDSEIEEDYYQTHAKDANVQVLPLSEASFPKTCYLVIDRSAELITRPLKEFADLGNIPSEEIGQETLPVFDNHRVARRFSLRSQRVIKVPDGRILEKTCSYLQAKGITRLLMDGQVYSLPSFKSES